MNAPQQVLAFVLLAVIPTAGYYIYNEMAEQVTPENAKGMLFVYTSPHCNACRMAKPTIDRLKAQGFSIKIIDVRRSPKKAGKADVAFLPTFVHFANGKETARIVGTATEQELRLMFRP
jgi:thiol-disulfide isomerase/thioredoxin